MNKKLFWIIAIIVVIAGIVFYKSEKVSSVSFSDNQHIQFNYTSDLKLGRFYHSPNEYTLQPIDAFVPESNNKAIRISITGHCMNTQCLTVYNLEDMVKEFGVEIIGNAKTQNVNGYEVKFPDNKIGYMFIKGKDLVTIYTDTYNSYMSELIPTIKLLAAE